MILSKRQQLVFDQLNDLKPEYIIGIDETGTGSLIGDVYVGAFLAPTKWTLKGIDDSKELTPVKRDNLATQLMVVARENGFGASIVHCHTDDKDRFKDYGTNLHSCLKFLYYTAVSRLLDIAPITVKRSYAIILDGIIKFPNTPNYLGTSFSLPKGDALIPQISAASIISKVTRDAYMDNLHIKYPNYNLNENRGYPTKDHLEALKKFGICKEHRTTYKPIKKFL